MRQSVTKLLRKWARIEERSYRSTKRGWRQIPRNRRYGTSIGIMQALQDYGEAM